MSSELQKDSPERLDQIIRTVFACRSVVKYNSVLSGEQKDELLADIDICLRSLRTDFSSGATTQSALPQPQIRQTSAMMPITTTEKRDKDTRRALQELYRIYHAYIDTKQSNNIGTLVARFDAVVVALNEVQRLLNMYQDRYVRPADDPLKNVNTFVADLYYMFMELVRTLSNVLESNDVHIDTEKLLSAQKRHLRPKNAADPTLYFSPLSEAFLEHQRLNKMKGPLSRRINDARAFLVFMRENFEGDSHQRTEILVHLSSVAFLLEDLAYVLSGYEDAAILLLESGKDRVDNE